jgi:hypothetical protein
MTNRKLAILAIVAAFMVLLVTVQTRFASTARRGSVAGASLIQGLDTAKIHLIEIGSGENPVRLVRQGGLFVVADKDNYPAETAKINDLITSCLDIKTLELITSNPANFDELGVADEKAEDVVKFLDTAEKLITGAIIGRDQSGTKSKYVRLAAGNDVYTATDLPTIRDEPLGYVDKEIVNIDRDEVAKVIVTGAGESYTLTNDPNDTTKVVLHELPEDKTLKETDAQSVMNALSYFSFTDVKSDKSFDKDELEFDKKYVCRLKNSVVYTFDIAANEGRTFVKCSAQYTAGEILKEQAPLEEKDAALTARDDAAKFTDKHRGWIYEIAQWKAKNLTRPASDILEDKKEQEQPQEQAETPKKEQGSAAVEAETETEAQTQSLPQTDAQNLAAEEPATGSSPDSTDANRPQ